MARKIKDENDYEGLLSSEDKAKINTTKALMNTEMQRNLARYNDILKFPSFEEGTNYYAGVPLTGSNNASKNLSSALNVTNPSKSSLDIAVATSKATDKALANLTEDDTYETFRDKLFNEFGSTMDTDFSSKDAFKETETEKDKEYTPNYPLNAPIPEKGNSKGLSLDKWEETKEEAPVTSSSITQITRPAETKDEVVDGGKEEESNDTIIAGSVADQVDNYLSGLQGKDLENNYLSAIQEYLDRKNFAYDPLSDPMYQSYLNTMQSLGQTAMKDAMGQASALSGGYNSSYAQNVGTSTYNNYLAQANEALPTFYNQALNQYNEDGNLMKEKINYLGSLYDTSNANALSQYNAETDRLKAENTYNVNAYNAETNRMNAETNRLKADSSNDYSASEAQKALELVNTGNASGLDSYLASLPSEKAGKIMTYLESVSPVFEKTGWHKYKDQYGTEYSLDDIADAYGLSDDEKKTLNKMSEGEVANALDWILNRIGD